jgi:hypothetical protein
MSARILLPKTVRVTSQAKRAPRIWSEEGSIYKRLPDFYIKSYLETRARQTQHVHIIPESKKYQVHLLSGTKYLFILQKTK